jgi:hypothetical protein
MVLAWVCVSLIPQWFSLKEPLFSSNRWVERRSYRGHQQFHFARTRKQASAPEDLAAGDPQLGALTTCISLTRSNCWPQTSTPR